MRRRIFIISPLRGTPAQLRAIEDKAAAGMDGLDAGAVAYHDTILRKYRRDLYAANIALAERLCLECSILGHAPFAPHLLYTRFLDDTDDVQRATGIESGAAWLQTSEAIWVYRRLGISTGMDSDIEVATKLGLADEAPEGWR